MFRRAEREAILTHEEGAPLKELLGAVLWAATNYLYVDFRRKGRKGLVRFLLYWSGAPLTWVWYFTVEEGEPPPLVQPMDDGSHLLEEIRREKARELMEGSGRGTTAGTGFRHRHARIATLEGNGPADARSQSRTRPGGDRGETKVDR